jgi:outer membrane lipoprotein carrier protein
MFKIIKQFLLHLSLIVFFNILIFCNQAASAAQTIATIDIEQQAKHIQNIYSKLTSLEFNFTQITRTGEREKTGTGNAVFYRAIRSSDKNNKRTNAMRWNYSSPDEQIITNDGENITIYTKKDQQMLITPADALESDITFAFLSGSKKLLDDFLVEKPDTRFSFSLPGKDIQSLQLIPREPHSQVKAIHIWFDETYIIHSLIIEDHFDSVTDLNFTNIQLDHIKDNSAVKLEEILHFPIPPETEIISQ